MDRMSVTSIQGGATAPVFLPLRRAGDDFSASLRAQVRAEVAGAIAEELAAGGGETAGRTAALQQALLTRRASDANSTAWTQLSRNIGGQYLAPQTAEVFSRQMALESGNFDPDVIYGRRVSSAGAEGIAQLMPSSYPHVNRLDPVASLHAAAGTMRANLQRYGGDLAKALAAYNAGAGTVDGLVARLGPAWQSGLPDETQVYLRELLGSTHA
jgi:soluble lytic murein transglycosylase-like protein